MSPSIHLLPLVHMLHMLIQLSHLAQTCVDAKTFKYKCSQVMVEMHFGRNENNVTIPLLQNTQWSEISRAKNFMATAVQTARIVDVVQTKLFKNCWEEKSMTGYVLETKEGSFRYF